jgi:alpha-1,2-mannosyltransferase
VSTGPFAGGIRVDLVNELLGAVGIDWTLSISGLPAAEPRSSGWIRTGRWLTFATVAAVTVIWARFFLGQLGQVHGNDLSSIDLLVYRAGGHAVLSGHSLYAADFAAVNHSPNGLPFTYPPFSALVFVPLAIVPVGLAKVLMVVLNAAACTTLFIVILVAVQPSWNRLRSWGALTAPISVKTASAVLASAFIFVNCVPIQDNFGYGQINLILAAAVALDILPPRVPWPRGMLVGLAVAVKLTPAVFVGYFVVTRQWRAVAVSLVSATLAVALGWLVHPSDTVRYVSSIAFDAGRIGGLAYSSNQSVRGIIERIPALDAMRGVIWMVATALVVMLASVAIEVSRRRGDTVAAMLSASFIGLLCSPVSWSHHWVWLPATVLYLLVRWATVGGIGNLVAGIAVALVTRNAPWTSLPSTHLRERLWTPSEHLLGSVWALTGVALLVFWATARKARPAAAKPEDDAAGSVADA